ncbi:MAG TPA: D-alanyl-D-alanine carboxypeptidase [Chitinophagaceae bacterium]|nr:D-alanyl-D-alanine carboxypeptidase [Chitinophagaceae bacterium]
MNKCLVIICWVLLAACSAQKVIHRSAGNLLFKDTAIANAHVGISIYDANTDKYLYNYQGNKYFVPASNVKIFTCYAGLKYLGDSVPGMQYVDKGDSIYLFSTGDPTFLHKDYVGQPVADFLRRQQKPLVITASNWRDNALGFGWTWDDYNSSYMAERSPLPVYGNIIRFIQTQDTSNAAAPEPVLFTEPDINWKINFNPDPATRIFSVRRQRESNIFRVTTGTEKQQREQEVPFVTNGLQSAVELLKDAVEKDLIIIEQMPSGTATRKTIYSRPTDSLLRPMMHRSDNFFAEQVVLMASNLKLGVMDDARLMENLLNNDLKGLPQRPRWVDGSGLSRYNLFTPQDFVWILNRMKDEFSFERLKAIFPTGGQGTLRDYYKSDSGYLFAKTGTLSGHLALSGYIMTRKNKMLIFSVIVNNHNGSAPAIRRRVEEFLREVTKNY